MKSLSGHGPASPSCYCLHLGVSVHRKPTPPHQPGAHLSLASASLPFYLPLKSSFLICAVNFCAKVLACMHSYFSCAQLSVTLWTVAHQVPLSTGLSRYEYWSGLPCPPPGDLPNPEIKPVSLTSPALTDGFLTTNAPGKPLCADAVLQNHSKQDTPCISTLLPPVNRAHLNHVHWLI